MKLYKSILKIVQIAVILVVLPRVASFLGLLGGDPANFDIHDLIRTAFAVVLGFGVISTAYFSEQVDPPEYEDDPGSNYREKKRREREAVYFATMNNAAPIARRAMFVFAALDGTFNLADAFYGASQSGILDPDKSGQYLVYIYGAATAIFGVAPTVLAIVLSRVISAVDRIPADYEKPAGKGEVDVLYTILKNAGIRVYSRSQAANLLTSEDQAALPERISGERPNMRTANIRAGGVRPNSEQPSGEQKRRIIDYLNSQPWEQVPSISQIQAAIGEPLPSRSTVSTARAEWLSNR